MRQERTSILDRIPAPALVIIALSFYQVGAAIAINLFTIVGPGGTTFLRIGLSAILLIILQKGILTQIKGKTLLWTVLFGVSLAGMNFMFYSAIERIPLGVAATIEFAGPLIVAVAGSRRLIDFVCVALATAGILLFAPFTGAQLDTLGVLYALIAAGFWAFYILLSAKVGKLIPGRSGLTLAMIVGGLIMLPIGLFDAGTAIFNPFILGAGLLLALLSSTLPYSFEIEALRRIPPYVFGILVSLEPAVATVAGVTLLHQPIGLRDIIALLLVVSASLIVTLHTRKKEPTLID